jgi:hypothetical protein
MSLFVAHIDRNEWRRRGANDLGKRHTQTRRVESVATPARQLTRGQRRTGGQPLLTNRGRQLIGDGAADAQQTRQLETRGVQRGSDGGGGRRASAYGQQRFATRHQQGQRHEERQRALVAGQHRIDERCARRRIERLGQQRGEPAPAQRHHCHADRVQVPCQSRLHVSHAQPQQPRLRLARRRPPRCLSCASSACVRSTPIRSILTVCHIGATLSRYAGRNAALACSASTFSVNNGEHSCTNASSDATPLAASVDVVLSSSDSLGRASSPPASDNNLAMASRNVSTNVATLDHHHPPPPPPPLPPPPPPPTKRQLFIWITSV